MARRSAQRVDQGAEGRGTDVGRELDLDWPVTESDEQRPVVVELDLDEGLGLDDPGRPADLGAPPGEGVVVEVTLGGEGPRGEARGLCSVTDQPSTEALVAGPCDVAA